MSRPRVSRRPRNAKTKCMTSLETAGRRAIKKRKPTFTTNMITAMALEGEGLIERRPHRGVFAADIFAPTDKLVISWQLNVNELDRRLGRREHFPRLSKIPRDEVIKMKRQWGAQKARAWKRLRQAERSGDSQTIIKAAVAAVGLYDYSVRLPVAMREVFKFGNSREATDKGLFWPILLKLWDRFEGTAADCYFWQNCLVELIERHGPRSAFAFLPKLDKRFFDALPKTITVYRGFSGTHYPGLSWTTKLSTAAIFASRGTRLGREAAIAVATISKRNPKLYFPSQRRGEYEIVCRPRMTDFQMHTPETLDNIMHHG